MLQFLKVPPKFDRIWSRCSLIDIQWYRLRKHALSKSRDLFGLNKAYNMLQSLIEFVVVVVTVWWLTMQVVFLDFRFQHFSQLSFLFHSVVTCVCTQYVWSTCNFLGLLQRQPRYNSSNSHFFLSSISLCVSISANMHSLLILWYVPFIFVAIS